jgi:Na+-driven multidrug efflux pump
LLTVLCQFESRTFMRVFTQEEAVVVVGTGFLVISAWNFAANGVIFSCSAMFQALGNTWPSIVSSSIRVFIFIVPAFWLSRRQGFELTHVWYVMLVSMLIQAGISYGLVRREFGLRLTQ